MKIVGLFISIALLTVGCKSSDMTSTDDAAETSADLAMPAPADGPPRDLAKASGTDGIKNGTETDVDGGGGGCGAWPMGRGCLAGSDWVTNFCDGNSQCASCTQDTDCPFKVCKNGACSTFPIVGVLNGQTFYKVPVMGTMTDTNIYNACKDAGLHTPCAAMGNCFYNDKLCVMSQETVCGIPMSAL